jgi:hypothetical protein
MKMSAPPDLRSDERKAIDAAIDRAVAAERERCAKIAERVAIEAGDGEGEIYIARKIADAIRRS